jgi:hypothetical protein
MFLRIIFGATESASTEESLLCHFRRLDPSAQGLISMTAERLAAGRNEASQSRSRLALPRLRFATLILLGRRCNYDGAL